MGFDGYIQLSADVFVDNRIFVDAEFGDDASGERENKTKPFATIDAALAVYQSGDTVEVHGDHTITSSITIPADTRVIFEFAEGSSVTGDLTDQLIDTANSNASYQINGNGTFRNDTTVATGQVRVFGGDVEILGARSISTGIGSICNNWRNIKNVPEFYSESGTAVFVLTNAEHDGQTQGVIENVYFGKVGGPGYPMVSILTSTSTAVSRQDLLCRNCTFVGESATALGTLNFANANGNMFMNFEGCNLISLDRQRCAIYSGNQNHIVFKNCYLEANADLGVINVAGDNKTIFRDCAFKNNSTSSTFGAVNSAKVAPPEFHGVNRMETQGTISVSSNSEVKIQNHGVIIANTGPVFCNSQIWEATGVVEPPTVGDIFRITANDGTFVEYTVQGGDTESDVYDGLVAACLVEKAKQINDFAFWNYIRLGVGPYRIRMTAINADHNYNVSIGQTWSVSVTVGSDPFALINSDPSPQTACFVMVGGEFIIQDTLEI